MDEKLDVICMQVADRSIEFGKQCVDIINNIVNGLKGRKLTHDEKAEMLGISNFMYWAHANGAWSFLDNEYIRKRLLERSVKYVTIAEGYESANDDENKLMKLMPELDLKFKIRMLDYNKKIKELEDTGVEFNSNVVMLVVLEWIQKYLNFSDEEMNVVSREFVLNIPDYVVIHKIAKQVECLI